MTIREFFEQHPKVAIALSSGVDSAYLLYAAVKYADKVKTYYAKSEFQPQFQLSDAMRLVNELGADIKVLMLNVPSLPCASANPSDCCYLQTVPASPPCT